MLPAFVTSSRKAVTVAVAAAMITAMAAPPAMAWGDKEQNFLAGVAATLLVGGLIQANNHPRPQPQPQPYYVPPQQPAYYDDDHGRGHGYGHSHVRTYSSLYQTPAAKAFNAYSSNERRRIQSTLSAYGYYRGGIDGSFGPGTYDAVTSYAANTGKTRLLGSRGGAFSLYDGLLF